MITVKDFTAMRAAHGIKGEARPPNHPEQAQRYSPDGEGGMEVDSLGSWVKWTPTPPHQKPEPHPAEIEQMLDEMEQAEQSKGKTSETPPPRQPLTKEQCLSIYSALDQFAISLNQGYELPWLHVDNRDQTVVHLIQQAAHGIKLKENI